MTDTYTKLFSSITESTIWSEPAGTRLVWITMLAKCNRHGEMFGSVPGLARLANVTLAEAEAALTTLLAPDRWSRTPDHEGRRIEPIDGGWRLLNFAKFDRMRSEAEAAERMRERKREWDRDNRPSGYARTKVRDQFDESPTRSDAGPTKSVPPPTATPDKRTTEAYASVVPGKPGTPMCPHAEIIAAYHAILPALARVREWTDARQAFLRKRWAESAERQSLDWWREFFAYVAQSDFLMGRTEGRDGRAFECDLEWLIRPRNFVRVLEGRYENRRAA